MNAKIKMDKILLDLQECYVMMRKHEQQRERYNCELPFDKQEEYFEDLHYERDCYQYYVGLIVDNLKSPEEKIDIKKITEYKEDYVKAHQVVERYGLK